MKAEIAGNVVAVFLCGAGHGEDHAGLPEGLAKAESFGDLELRGVGEFANFRTQGESGGRKTEGTAKNGSQRESHELSVNALFLCVLCSLRLIFRILPKSIPDTLKRGLQQGPAPAMRDHSFCDFCAFLRPFFPERVKPWLRRRGALEVGA